MAKWGEGDPRWIVEERPDAKNVNNWHWTEKNAGPWSLDKFKELFTNTTVNSDLANITIQEVEKSEGEASASNRKGKLIFFYEWNLHLKWSGALKNGSGTTFTGTVKIPNVSEENDVSEYDIQISVKEEDDEGAKLKQIMQKDGGSIIKSQLTKYIFDLKEEFTKGMILPKKDQVKPDNVKTFSSGYNKKIDMPPIVSQANNVGSKIDTTEINVVQKFHCKAQDFYDAMTRIEMVTAFTKGHVKLNCFKGGKFELFGGNISGEFIDLVPAKKIVQRWRYKQWPAGHFSNVIMNIDEKDDHTEVSLIQTGVPAGEAEVTKTNWQRYYWDAMKQTFGFGTFFT